MKVRILVSIAGLPMPEYGVTSYFALQAGDELELHDELAQKWIASGKVESIEPVKPRNVKQLDPTRYDIPVKNKKAKG